MMKRNTALWFVIFFGGLFTAQSQPIDVKEAVFVHLSSSFLITGETLHYSAQVVSQSTGKPSLLSQILYVELVGALNETLFQHKVVLSDGKGFGQFFVSSLIPTGQYRLIAYTRWMKNFGDVFQAPLTLVNPYEAYENPVVKQAYSLNFFPEGENLMVGRRNLVVFKITDEWGNGVPLKGRVMKLSGDKVADLAPDPSGIGRFEFLPIAGEEYQAIVEDEMGNFLFFKLPAAKANLSSIQVTEERDRFQVEAQAANSADSIWVNVTDGQNTVIKQAAQGNMTFSLSKSDLKPGLFWIQAETAKGTIYRPIANLGSVKAIQKAPIQAAPRSKIVLPIEVTENAVVSVSVHLKADTERVSAVQFAQSGRRSMAIPEVLSGIQLENWLLTQKLDIDDALPAQVALQPEVRGELVSGRVEFADSMRSSSMLFAFSGESGQVWPSQLDPAGRFQFRIDPAEGDLPAYLRVFNAGNAKITLEKPFLEVYPPWDYQSVRLDSVEIVQLVQRSIQNQIENAYFQKQGDTIIASRYWRPQFEDFNFFYRLDDYKRFPELYEHFIEYIPTVVARKNSRRSKVKILNEHTLIGEHDPLLLLDGVPVTAEELLNVNPYLIESIGVINNRIFMGEIIADGLLVVQSYKGDLEGFKPTDQNLLKLTYQGVEPRHVPTFPTYDEGVDRSRIPDYRTLLYWDPALQLLGGSPSEILFFTGDVVGDFEICIEGFTRSGQPISIRQSLHVAP